jgi:signal transduction histidine kinase
MITRRSWRIAHDALIGTGVKIWRRVATHRVLLCVREQATSAALPEEVRFVSQQSDAPARVDEVAILRQIVQEYRRRMQIGAISGVVSRAVVGMLDEASGRAVGVPADGDPTGEARSDGGHHDGWASDRTNPGDQLRAVAQLYEVALPILAARRAGDDERLLATVNTVLNRVASDLVNGVVTRGDSLAAERRGLSRQEERRRLARELHDRVGHGMALALQNLDLHRHYLSRDPLMARAKLDLAAAAIGEAMQTIQQLSSELRRSVSDRGIGHALRTYLGHHVPSTVRTLLDVPDRVEALSPEVSEELYLILREAVHNAVRHARATELRVHLRINADKVDAAVSDNGTGFDQHAATAASLGGLTSMRERAALLRGSLRLTSVLGLGTTVSVAVPLTGRPL